jgi:5-methylcytosine-specific restriction protein A
MRNQQFRNPDGVAFKLINLSSVKTGRGLKNNSRLDRETWAELGAKPGAVSALAESIRSVLRDDLEALSKPYFPDDIKFPEGRVMTEIHHRRERHPAIRRRLLASRRRRGSLLRFMQLDV